MRGVCQGGNFIFQDFPAIIFDTKKPQTDLTEWGWCGKLQGPNGYTLLGWLLT